MLSEFCEFGDMFDNMIREHLVCDINDDKIQQTTEWAETNTCKANTTDSSSVAG